GIYMCASLQEFFGTGPYIFLVPQSKKEKSQAFWLYVYSFQYRYIYIYIVWYICPLLSFSLSYILCNVFSICNRFKRHYNIDISSGASVSWYFPFFLLEWKLQFQSSSSCYFRCRLN